ncbi:hypothetical protein LNTAR_21715 [Lentisphaera araneosa HTCC2155]|uniref:Uncharacterized protein n=1 Tax=Lentisphaera araneosa HTCC2155 TaxID=313628 RepID=A6DM77_9BACT|nr:hypothetical protein LNTAR_21715 [Lentisphaera araneosa HTCC2155]
MNNKINNIEFKKERWRYFSFAYISIAFFPIVLGMSYESIQSKNSFGIALCSILTISYLIIIVKSCVNLTKIVKAIKNKKEYIDISPVNIVTSVTNRSLEKREYKFLFAFATLIYISIIIGIIMER